MYVQSIGDSVQFNGAAKLVTIQLNLVQIVFLIQ